MTTARIFATVQHYRQLLMQHDAQAQRQLDAAFRQVLDAINPALARLQDQMVEALANGDKLPASFLYENHRLETIKRLISGQLNQYGALSYNIVGRLQQDGVKLGLEASLAMLDASVPSGVNFAFGVPSMHAVLNSVAVTQAGSPLHDLFRDFGAEAAEKAGRALVLGVSLGNNPRKIASDMRDALNVSRARALIISRTESIRAYRTANIETFRANDDVVDSWIWSADLSPRTCAACIAMNGTKHSLDEQMESHPSCRCTQIPLTKSWSDILGPGFEDIPDTRVDVIEGIDWFHEQSAETQKSILGPGRYAAWKDGKFSFKNIVQRTHNGDWGGSIQVKPLKDLVKA